MSVRVQHIRGTTTEIESVTPQAAELGYDTTKKEAHIGDGATAGGMRLAKKNIAEILTPSQITSNQNNYSPTNLKHARALNLTSDAARDITGIVPTTVTDSTDGRELDLYNAGSFAITLRDASGSSTAANRFDFGADIALSVKQSVSLRYDVTASRWRLKASTAGQAISDGAAGARTLAASAIFNGAMINGKLVWSVAGNGLTVAVKTLAGGDPSAADPVWVTVRDVTASDGSVTVMQLTAALSCVASPGSTLGTTNNTAFGVKCVLFNDAGTPRLGLINTFNGTVIFPLTAWGVASSTAEGGAGAADSAHTFYTGTAVTAKPYTYLGYANWETGLATAGTWSSAATRVQLFGPGVPLPGHILQTSFLSSPSLATGATTVPKDNTIPQNTEGDQYMSLAHTPVSACNLLEVEWQFIGSNATGSGGYEFITALFIDSGANAVATASGNAFATSALLQVLGKFRQLAGAVSALTFKLRAGGETSTGTTSFNGRGGVQTFNGTSNSYLQVREFST